MSEYVGPGEPVWYTVRWYESVKEKKPVKRKPKKMLLQPEEADDIEQTRKREARRKKAKEAFSLAAEGNPEKGDSRDPDRLWTRWDIKEQAILAIPLHRLGFFGRLRWILTGHIE